MCGLCYFESKEKDQISTISQSQDKNTWRKPVSYENSTCGLGLRKALNSKKFLAWEFRSVNKLSSIQRSLRKARTLPLQH